MSALATAKVATRAEFAQALTKYSSACVALPRRLGRPKITVATRAKLVIGRLWRCYCYRFLLLAAHS